MTSTHRRLMATVACLASLALGSATAAAQNGKPPIEPMPPSQAPAVAARSQANVKARQAPTARILGVPVTADAPVNPSYDGTAYKTLGGQPETGADAIAGQVMQPQDATPR